MLIIHFLCAEQPPLNKRTELSRSFMERGLREVGTEKAYTWGPLLKVWGHMESQGLYDSSIFLFEFLLSGG